MLMSAQTCLQFLYPSDAGIALFILLRQWSEHDYYLSATHDGEERLFRKDAITFLADSHQLLKKPFVPVPPLPNQDQRIVEVHVDGMSEDGLEELYEEVRRYGFGAYSTADKPDAKRGKPGFWFRAGVTLGLQYYLCAPAVVPGQDKVRSLKTRISERGKTAGQASPVIVQSLDAFLGMLKTGALSALEPEWRVPRKNITPPSEDEAGYFIGWAFQLGRWFHAALDIEPYRPSGWTQSTSPNYQFSSGDVFNRHGYGVSLQVDSSLPGFHGVSVIKMFQGNQPAGYFRCKNYELALTLQDGDLSRLRKIQDESAFRKEKMRAAARQQKDENEISHPNEAPADASEVSSVKVMPRTLAVTRVSGAGKHSSSAKPDDCPQFIEFQYRNARGEAATYVLDAWVETRHYLQGITLDGYRTFRKDRVLTYHHGVEALLKEPFSPPPPRPSPVATKPQAAAAPEILFTGFDAKTRTELECLANQAGMKVVKTPTKNLSYLCGGPNAGPSKVEKARQAGAWILDEAALRVLLESGELPDPQEF